MVAGVGGAVAAGGGVLLGLGLQTYGGIEGLRKEIQKEKLPQRNKEIPATYDQALLQYTSGWSLLGVGGVVVWQQTWRSQTCITRIGVR